MASSSNTEPDKPPRSAGPQQTGRTQMVLGAGVAVVGAGLGVLGSWTAGIPLVVFGGLVGTLGVLARASGGGVPLVNTAYNAMLLGRVAEAERRLDDAERRFQLGYIRRVIDLQRANIAMRRGDLPTALVRVEAALTRRTGLLTRAQERGHLAAARAMRALLRASLGDGEGAQADAEAVAALPDAPRETLARAAVAEAIVKERSGDRDALAAHLRAKRALLLDHTVPRERAVIRAYQRMLEAPKTSVYRKRAAEDAEPPAGSEPSVGDWVATVAPAAAPFARRLRVHAPAAEPEHDAPPIEPGLLRVAEDRVKSPAAKGPRSAMRMRLKVLALWLLLIAMFLAVWQLLDGGLGSIEPPVEWSALPGVLLAILVTLATAVTVALIARNLRLDKRLAGAVGALARGEPSAIADIEALTRSRHPATIANAHRELALLDERRGDFAKAIERCDAGIAAATANGATRTMLSTILLPDLVAERAFLLAATDLPEKARAELAVLERAFPAYPYMARAELRASVVLRVRGGDIEGAARLVAATTEDLPLSQRDETLMDLVRAVAHPDATGAGELQRLRHELRVDAELSRWIRLVAPSLVRAFEAPGPTLETRDATRDDEAEREALAADEELAQARARPVVP